MWSISVASVLASDQQIWMAYKLTLGKGTLAQEADHGLPLQKDSGRVHCDGLLGGFRLAVEESRLHDCLVDGLGRSRVWWKIEKSQYRSPEQDLRAAVEEFKKVGCMVEVGQEGGARVARYQARPTMSEFISRPALHILVQASCVVPRLLRRAGTGRQQFHVTDTTNPESRYGISTP